MLTDKYECELELLVYSAWRRVTLVPVPVQVYYPPEGERVSHFRFFADFARISLLNTVLCIVAVFYGLPGMLIRKLMDLRKERWHIYCSTYMITFPNANLWQWRCCWRCCCWAFF